MIIFIASKDVSAKLASSLLISTDMPTSWQIFDTVSLDEWSLYFVLLLSSTFYEQLILVAILLISFE